MQLKPIDDACLGDAAALLSQGFPERSGAFWDSALARLSAYRRAADVGPIGQLMVVGDCAVGVILTIGSKRGRAPDERTVINLSSWYVDAKHRWLAPRMLQKVVADKTAIYTDISPSESTVEINSRLGFHVASQGVMLFVLPWLAMTRLPRSRIVPFAALSENALPAADYRVLSDHDRLGCLAAAIEADGTYHPLLFHKTRRKGFSVARLLFAESREIVGLHIAAVARFLLRHRVMMLTVHADTDTSMPGGITWNTRAPVQVKGVCDRGHVDHAFSELVFLRL
jgi:hypothetical protein